MRIVFFDGYCSLCNGVVDGLFQKDHFGRLKYASLQGETARRLLSEADRRNVDTIVYSRDGVIYRRSAAVLRILMDLQGVWMLFGVLLLVPQFIRDWIYELVARHRYEIFGKRETCRVPTAAEKESLLP